MTDSFPTRSTIVGFSALLIHAKISHWVFSSDSRTAKLNYGAVDTVDWENFTVKITVTNRENLTCE